VTLEKTEFVKKFMSRGSFAISKVEIPQFHRIFESISASDKNG
jgi:hypothetical protein